MQSVCRWMLAFRLFPATTVAAIPRAATKLRLVPFRRPTYCACAVRTRWTATVARYSNEAPPPSGETPPPVKLSSIQRVKIVMRDYGTVGVVFHTVMSLCSLGTCYLVVSSGVDVGKVLEYFNVQSSVASKGASTLAVAYVLHKLFLPARAAITVGCVPLIVRWLRAKGWVRVVAKQPK